MQKINNTLLAQTASLAKEAANAGGTGQYALNSYAFYPPALTTCLHLFMMSGLDKQKIESLFVEPKDDVD